MWKTIVPLALFAVHFCALSLTSMRQQGTTSDERAHLPAGYTYVRLGDFRMNPEDPPLIKALAGLALLPLRPRVETADPDWRNAKEWEFGAKFLYDWNDADQLLFWGRAPVVLLTLILGVVVYCCARELYGWVAGCVALTLYLFNPDLLAHGQLVTTDLGVSLFIFLSVYLFYRALQRLTAANLVGLCLAVGMALITKLSAPLVFPMLLLVGGVWVYAGGPAVVFPTREGEHSAQRLAFLHGERSLTGWWYYFPVTFLIKTPLPLIALIILGFAFIRRDGAGLVAESMLLLPVGLYSAVSPTSNLNIGHRHLLPIYPFLIVFASKTGRYLEAHWRAPGKRRWLAAGCALLLVWAAAEGLRVYLHYLAYFNQIAGGPGHGYRWLVDSNLDWGQDLKGLAAYRQEHPNDPFYLCYFGSDSPLYRRLQTRYLPGWPLGGWPSDQIRYETFNSIPPGATVAVSATYLQLLISGLEKDPELNKFMERLRRQTPFAQVGHSINLYRLE